MLKKLNIKAAILETQILPLLWEFTSSQDFEVWDEKTKKINPLYILEHNEDSDITHLYSTLPPFVNDIISDIIDIGTANLYGGTGEYSSYTLLPLTSVVDNCNSHKVDLPDLGEFLKSQYVEDHGWGLPRERSFFIHDECA